MSLKNTNVNSEYVLNYSESAHEEYDGDAPDNSKFVPFRFMVHGPFNIRKQPVNNHYKTFVGDRTNEN